MVDQLIGIAGAGRVARALGRVLVDSGEPLVCVASRKPEHAIAAARFLGPGIEGVEYPALPAKISRVIIAVPDHALTDVSAMLVEKSVLVQKSTLRVALHTCGTRGPEALAALREHGVACGGLHPLQTLSGNHLGTGVAFAVCGDAAAVEWAEHIVQIARGEVLRIAPEMRPIYHAAAVMTSNYVMALIDAAQTLLEQCGVERHSALRALGPLVRTSAGNALERSPVEALTGPIERGDAETIAAHLRALEGPILSLYRTAGLYTLGMARRRGLDPARAASIEELLHGNAN